MKFTLSNVPVLFLLLTSCTVYQKELEDIKDPPLTTTNIIINQNKLYDTAGKVKGFLGCINLKCNLYDTRSGYGYNKGNYIVVATEKLSQSDTTKIAQCIPSKYCSVSLEGKYEKAPKTSAGIAFIAHQLRYISRKPGTIEVDVKLQ